MGSETTRTLRAIASSRPVGAAEFRAAVRQMSDDWRSLWGAVRRQQARDRLPLMPMSPLARASVWQGVGDTGRCHMYH